VQKKDADSDERGIFEMLRIVTCFIAGYASGSLLGKSKVVRRTNRAFSLITDPYILVMCMREEWTIAY
jgi:hypothetical protein